MRPAGRSRRPNDCALRPSLARGIDGKAIPNLNESAAVLDSINRMHRNLVTRDFVKNSRVATEPMLLSILFRCQNREFTGPIGYQPDILIAQRYQFGDGFARGI